MLEQGAQLRIARIVSDLAGDGEEEPVIAVVPAATLGGGLHGMRGGAPRLLGRLQAIALVELVLCLPEQAQAQLGVLLFAFALFADCHHLDCSPSHYRCYMQRVEPVRRR